MHVEPAPVEAFLDGLLARSGYPRLLGHQNIGGGSLRRTQRGALTQIVVAPNNIMFGVCLKWRVILKQARPWKFFA